MDNDEHRKQMEAFIDTPEPELKGNIAEALYTMSELGLWPDSISSVSMKQALLCWKLVEKLRREDFPDILKM